MKIQSAQYLGIVLTLLALSSCGKGEAPSTEQADAEAEKIRQARIQEQEDKENLAKFNLPNWMTGKETPPSNEANNGNSNDSPVPFSCKYSSSIHAAPPFKRVALTFDDGPSPETTEYVLAILKKQNVVATFFVTGSHAQAYPQIMQKIMDAGHLIVGNHSWDHADFHDLGVKQQFSQIAKTQKVLSMYQSQKFFRFPFGNSTCDSINFAHARGYKIVGWHVDSCDWAFNKTGIVSAEDAAICEVKNENRDDYVGHVLQQVRAQQGGIVLMHDIQANTIKKLDKIIQRLKAEGFSFGAINEKGFAPSLK